MPCRCGQSWTSGPGPRSPIDGATAVERDAGVEPFEVAAPGEHGVDHTPALREHRRAGDVGHDPAGAYGVGRRAQQRPLQDHQPVDVGGLATPPRLGAPPQRAEPRARSVDEDPVEAGVGPGPGAAVADHDLGARPDRTTYELRTVRLRLVGGESRASGLGQPGQERRLAAGSGAEVEPAEVGTARGLESGSRRGEGDQLAALVLDADVTAAHRLEGRRVAGRQDARQRGPPAGRGAERDAGRPAWSDPGARPG